MISNFLYWLIWEELKKKGGKRKKIQMPRFFGCCSTRPSWMISKGTEEHFRHQTVTYLLDFRDSISEWGQVPLLLHSAHQRHCSNSARRRLKKRRRFPLLITRTLSSQPIPPPLNNGRRSFGIHFETCFRIDFLECHFASLLPKKGTVHRWKLSLISTFVHLKLCLQLPHRTILSPHHCFTT